MIFHRHTPNTDPEHPWPTARCKNPHTVNPPRQTSFLGTDADLKRGKGHTASLPPPPQLSSVMVGGVDARPREGTYSEANVTPEGAPPRECGRNAQEQQVRSPKIPPKLPYPTIDTKGADA